MTICSSIFCPECGKLLNDSTRRPCIGKCHHSICSSCKDSLECGKCPICDEVGAFQETVYNHQTVNFLADFQKSISEKDFLAVMKNIENIGHGPCSKCHEVSGKLRICTKCTSVVRNDEHGWRPVDFEKKMYLKILAMGFCASCALDHHAGHKPIVQIMNLIGMPECLEFLVSKALRIFLERNNESEDDLFAKQLKDARLLALDSKVHDQLVGMSEYEIDYKDRTTDPVYNACLRSARDVVAMYSKLHTYLLKFYKSKQTESLLDKQFTLNSSEKTAEYNKLSAEYDEARGKKPNNDVPADIRMGFEKETLRRLYTEVAKMAKRYPERSTDKYFLRFEVLKEQIEEKTLAKKEKQKIFANIYHEISDKYHQFITNPDDNIRKEVYSINFLKKHLASEVCTVESLKAEIDLLYVWLMFVECCVMAAHDSEWASYFCSFIDLLPLQNPDFELI